MEELSVGMNVLIKRSDGRVHDALISQINSPMRSVTVEWFEKGETKGKEIDVEQLFELNPKITDEPEPSALRSSPAKEPEKRVTRRTQAPPPPANRQRKEEKPAAPTRGHTMVQQNGNGKESMEQDGEESEEEDENALPEIPAHNNNNYKNRAPFVPPAAKRKSQTVQEIEKLKKNREERRAKQEEMRAQKEALKNIEPGNPHWEFLGMIREYQAKLDYRPLRVNDPIEDHKICVCVRKRPMNKKDLNKRDIDVATVPNKDHVVVHQPQTKVDLTKYLDNQIFRFDYAFDDNSTNDMVYRFTAQPLIRTVFEQGFATCFAYGQTGSGKTHTMGGDFDGKNQDASKGIYAMTARDVFKLLTGKEYKKENLIVSCSFFEIYSGKVFDLLNNKLKLQILEDGKREVQIVGLKEEPVSQEKDVLDLIRKGTDVRTAGQTSANNHSSRSHAVFQIILRKKTTRKLHGKFSLIDLAGNERGVDTISSDRQTRMEGAEINKSLLALKECIRAMGRKNTHVPFRASKLTLVLRDSFIGDNARTCMIAMVSPGLSSCEHTLNTLRYADRVKELGADDVEASGGGGGGRKPPNLPELDYPMNDGGNDDEDLALLQSRNEEEMTDELYNVQLALSHMQQAEEAVVDDHQRFVDHMKKWSAESGKLLKMTEKVDYDVLAYAKDLRALLDRMSAEKDRLSGNVDKLLSQIQQEEIVAQKAGSKKRGK